MLIVTNSVNDNVKIFFAVLYECISKCCNISNFMRNVMVIVLKPRV